MGGAGFDTGGGGSGAWGGSLCVSGGPGPGTTMVLVGRSGRERGTRTAREWAFRAGLSTSALPAAFRMKVYTRVNNSQQHKVTRPTSGFLWYILPSVPVCNNN
jgi:hypothetical protein